MELHVVLPSEQPGTGAARAVALARRAEHLGYQGVYLPDHLLPPEPYGGTYGGLYEPLVTLSYIAAVTERVRLGTSVLLLALRNPFVVAKQAATLDELSGGRFTLGVGIGWDATEFAAVGADFADRGGRTDEALRLLRHLFTAGQGPFKGERFGFTTGVFGPAPGPGLKILTGGVSKPALRRAARFADVWQSLPMAPEEFAAHVAELRGLTERPLEVGARIGWDDPGRPVADVAEEVAAWAAAGADQLAVWFGDPDGFDSRMTALAEATGLTPGLG
ncbi:TIGR03619 family F420-dependent LLM class oxidoreductase [Streptomyces sp. NPDC020917]|uniref:TIGR03619 family F420-dependent LLM class oxidoreductase n=1 Tax=Streptomyces sp. NPDC020917 TaxID=3365102 RepID=UPI0037B44A05